MTDLSEFHISASKSRAGYGSEPCHHEPGQLKRLCLCIVVDDRACCLLGPKISWKRTAFCQCCCLHSASPIIFDALYISVKIKKNTLMMAGPTAQHVYFLFGSMSEYEHCRCHNNNAKKNCTCVAQVSRSGMGGAILIARLLFRLDRGARSNDFSAFEHILASHAYVPGAIDISSPKTMIFLSEAVIVPGSLPVRSEKVTITVCTHLMQYMVKRLYSVPSLQGTDSVSIRPDDEAWRKKKVSETLISGFAWIHTKKWGQAKNYVRWLLFWSVQLHLTSPTGDRIEIKWDEVIQTMNEKKYSEMGNVSASAADIKAWRSVYKSADWMLHQMKVAWPFRVAGCKRVPKQRVEGVSFLQSIGCTCLKLHTLATEFIKSWHMVLKADQFLVPNENGFERSQYTGGPSLSLSISGGPSVGCTKSVFSSLSKSVGVLSLETSVTFAVTELLLATSQPILVRTAEDIRKGTLPLSFRVVVCRTSRHVGGHTPYAFFTGSSVGESFDAIVPMAEEGCFLYVDLCSGKGDYIFIPFGAMVVAPSNVRYSCSARCHSTGHPTAVLRAVVERSDHVSGRDESNAGVRGSLAQFIESQPMIGMKNEFFDSPFSCSAMSDAAAPCFVQCTKCAEYLTASGYEASEAEAVSTLLAVLENNKKRSLADSEDA